MPSRNVRSSRHDEAATAPSPAEVAQPANVESMTVQELSNELTDAETLAMNAALESGEAANDLTGDPDVDAEIAAMEAAEAEAGDEVADEVGETPAEGADASTQWREPDPIDGDGIVVRLPVRFREGFVLDAYHAELVDTLFSRAFLNNQRTQAKTRKEARAKLGPNATEAERRKVRAWTEQDHLAAYAEYRPSVRGAGPSQAEAETKLRHDCAWEFFTDLVNRHNRAVEAGQPAVIPGQDGVLVVLPAVPRKARDQSEADAAAAKEAALPRIAGIVAKVLAHAEYGPQVEAMVQARKARHTPIAVSTSTGATVATRSADALFG